MLKQIGQTNYPSDLSRKDRSKCINYTCYNTVGYSTLEKYAIDIPRCESGNPEDWIIFVDLVQKNLVGQNVTTGSPMHKYMEGVLKGYVKAKFIQ